MSACIRWVEWSERAFARAAAENKPVLLSLVTAWSDECVLMDRTTYGHPDVISLVDARFVAIRVDADRRPDVNERYNLGGWPTTTFLTDTGEILSGGTFIGPEQMILLLDQVADTWRDRRAEIRARTAAAQPVPADGPPAGRNGAEPAGVHASEAVEYFRALLVERFDHTHGGFGAAPKLPHTSALMLALSLADEPQESELSGIVELTLDRMSALWDSTGGGFYRYADGADWTDPGPEKTLEDNAALLHVYVEAAMRRRSEEFRERAAAIARWITGTLADPIDGGFFNAQTRAGIDRSMYVDRNAAMVSALLRAAALLDDTVLRDLALRSFESVVLPGYAPGKGVAHRVPADDSRGLLTDQVAVASAAIWAHVATGQLPYSMLAAELMQFAIRTMWDEQAGRFRDRASADLSEEVGWLREPVRPFDVNCEAACVLDRLATLTGDSTYHARAVTILQSLSADYRRLDLFGAPYALAVREIVEHRAPLGLELTKIDWHLE